MTIKSSAERTSFTGYFDVTCGDKSWALSQVAEKFVIPKQPAELPTGPATLTIRYDDRPDPVHRSIEILGPDADRPERIRIRRH